MRKRRNELTALYKRLYEDNVLRHITNEQFCLISADYTAEQKALDDAIPDMETKMDKLKALVANVDAFVEEAKRYKTTNARDCEVVRCKN